MFQDPTDSFVGTVRHKTFNEVNEQGTEAAAAIEMGIVLGMPFEFIVDHPFLFAVHDSETRALLFLGALREP